MTFAKGTAEVLDGFARGGESPPGVKLNVNVLLAALLVTLYQVPSISVDLSVIFSYASDIVNMMMPIVGVGAGISFGFALVAYIIRLFRNIF